MSRLMRYNGLIVKPGSGSRLPPLPTMRDILKMQNLRALKQLSQNFIMDEQLSARIIRQCGDIQNYHVLEVGPGIGNITRSIIRCGPKKLVVVEKDRRFIPTLDMLANAVRPAINMEIYRDDILNFNIEHAFPDVPRQDWHSNNRPPVYLIGNLPFAISTRLLINWYKDISLKRSAWTFGRTPMLLTFQKEVGERIVAPLMDAQRCRLSVMSQIWSQASVRFTIPGRAFVPSPDVDVAVVRFAPLPEPLTTLPFDLVEKVVRHIFSMAPKKIIRPLQDLYPVEMKNELAERTVEMARVNPNALAVQLSTEECVRLAQAYSDILAEYPLIANYNRFAKKQKLRPDGVSLLQSDVLDIDGYDEYNDCDDLSKKIDNRPEEC